METVIAIGVLTVLLTAFMAVFGPAARGVRKAINVQEADRLTSVLESELTTLRPGSTSGNITNGFAKARDYIEKSNGGQETQSAVFIYQYKGNPNQLRSDGTMTPYKKMDGIVGKDYIVQPMVRRRDDGLLQEDLIAREGRIFVVKMTQLVQSTNGSGLTLGTPGKIQEPPATNSSITVPAGVTFTEAVLPFVADFYELVTVDWNYLGPGGAFKPEKLTSPMFSRNLAVRM